MSTEFDSEIYDLIKQLRQMQDKAEALAAHQHDLRDQLKAAEKRALELHQKIILDQCDVGGEG